MSTKTVVLTIDGPSGSGKGTISKRIAETLGWHYLDSGALYRALGVAAIANNIELDDEQALTDLANRVSLEFKRDQQQQWVVLLDGQEIQQQLQTEAVGDVASKLAVFAKVREALLLKQRGFEQAPGLVADGRDMGSVVFPNASNKVYLTASAGIRGKRRYKQLIEKGINANLRVVIEDIEQRDERDKNRSASPLIIPDDALVIDSSDIGIDEVVNQIVSFLNN
ncbi:MAG: cytidylate kinase [Piscirickettsiaceae bacterium]|nr:MAG: cytidylate kinase [Piscirickettsiaceae bacterium]PCI67831.1 MAG: cytidylate kinase [Piscirickettsiaceae bacterium]